MSLVHIVEEEYSASSERGKEKTTKMGRVEKEGETPRCGHETQKKTAGKKRRR